MRRRPAHLPVILFLSPLVAAAQTAFDPPLIPDYGSVKQSTAFLKDFTLQSFGFSSKATGPGYENPIRLSGAGELTGILECPLCIMRPAMERSRDNLPSFGAHAAWRPGNGRFELSGGSGGANLWKPDNTIITLDRRTSYANDWHLQGWMAAAFAVDPKKRVWLGGIVRAVRAFGPSQSRWKTFSGTATVILDKEK